MEANLIYALAYGLEFSQLGSDVDFDIEKGSEESLTPRIQFTHFITLFGAARVSKSRLASCLLGLQIILAFKSCLWIAIRSWPSSIHVSSEIHSCNQCVVCTPGDRILYRSGICRYMFFFKSIHVHYAFQRVMGASVLCEIAVFRGGDSSPREN